jgi:hypothetical protein
MTRRDAWGAGAVVAALMATYIAGSAWSAAIQDTARDVYYAYSIRHGLWFPAEGPILGGPVNGALHLGPAWYYVLSLPLFASDGWLSIALFAAALSSLKFPLAFALGRRALDAPMGIAWACCLALPGWHTFEQLIFFNPNPAAACVLGSVLMALRLRETGSRATAFGFGVLLALTLHVHPTCAPVAALALPALWRAQRRFVLTALLALGFVLPFAPYVAHQLAAGAPDAASTASYMSRQIGPVNLLNSPEVVAASIAGGPQALVAYLWPKSPGIPIIAAGVMAFLVGIAVVAALARRLPGEAMRVFGALWCAVAIFALWIALLRPTTPMYFMYALSPFTAGLAALGVWVALRAMPRPAGVVACLLAISLQAVVAYRLAATVRSGDGVLSARILDVKDRAANKVFHDTWFPAAGRASLGALLCRGDRPKSLHGHLAYVEDRGVGMDALFACGRAEQLRLAGARPDREHWVGMSRAFWKRLDASPACWSGSLGITRAARVAWPAEGIPLANGRRYFPRDPSRGALRPGSATMRASRSQALLVTNPLVGYEALEVVRVTADGNPVNALATNDLSYLFVAPAGPAEVTWSVTFAASAPQAADVVLFERRPAVNVADCASRKEP